MDTNENKERELDRTDTDGAENVPDTSGYAEYSEYPSVPAGMQDAAPQNETARPEPSSPHTGEEQPSGGIYHMSGAQLYRDEAARTDAAQPQEPPRRWNYDYSGSTPASEPVQKKHRSGIGGKILLVLICVLLSGGAAFGGTLLAGHILRGNGEDTARPTVKEQNETVTYIRSDEGMSRVELAAKVSPTVVQVTTEQTVTNFWMQQQVATGAGSGVIISEDGAIVTNNHVVQGANSIKVTLSTGEEYDAELVATDAQSDIAVIRIEAEDLPAAEIGDSDELVIGQDVIAVGNPLGELGGTVTNGIISAINREITVDSYKMTLIQTNTAINPGNSGGGLFDAEGRLIGIVNAKYSSSDVEGLGFAIPINTAMKSANDLIDSGYVRGRVNVGLSLLTIQDQQTAFQYRVDRLGVYVYSTVDGSSAQLAGFKTGDYIKSVNGVEVSTADEIKAEFAKYEIGDNIPVVIVRNDEEQTLTLILTEYAPDETDEKPFDRGR